MKNMKTMNNWLTRRRNRSIVPECFVEVIKAKYPTTNTAELARELGVKVQQLHDWARSLRVRKDKAFWSKECSIRSSIKHSVFVCERIGRAAE